MRSPNRVRTSSSHYNITHPNNYNPPHIYNNLSEKNNGNSRKPNYPINYPYNNANRLYKTTSQNIEPFSNRKTKSKFIINEVEKYTILNLKVHLMFIKCRPQSTNKKHSSLKYTFSLSLT